MSMMAHVNNPSYLGSRDWEIHGLRAACTKKVMIATNKLGMVSHTCDPRYTVALGRRPQVQAAWAKIQDPT
jgi:hypothetical protein